MAKRHYALFRVIRFLKSNDIRYRITSHTSDTNQKGEIVGLSIDISVAECVLFYKTHFDKRILTFVDGENIVTVDEKTDLSMLFAPEVK